MSARRLIAISNASRYGYDKKQTHCSFNISTNQPNNCFGGDFIMSKWAEIINIKTMTGTLLLNGEPSSGATKSSDAINAQRIEKLDKFGYQKSDPADEFDLVLW
jgi:hypothetical protein